MGIKLNIITLVVICIAIISNVIRVISTIIRFSLHDSYTQDFLVYQIIAGIVISVDLIMILKLKSEAVYLFFVIQFINGFINGSFTNDYLPHYISAILFSIIMAGLLCLKKDGISGWYLIKNNKKNM